MKDVPWFWGQSGNDLRPAPNSSTAILKEPQKKVNFDVKLWGLSLLSLLPWAMKSRDNIRKPTSENRESRKRTKPETCAETGGSRTALRFRPYVSKVPWHTGIRAFLSQLFPRYGHYCGPNWSSGKDKGSPIWDKRPIDWLDFCCYCHDIGYDTHDQAMLLKADLEFLQCLERRDMITKGNPHAATLYRTMYLAGLKNVLIPYRRNLVELQSGRPLIQFGWLCNIKWKSWDFIQLKKGSILKSGKQME